MITAPVFYAVAVPSVILLGLSKGGFSGMGILALPLMALAISPVQAAAIMLPILLVQDAVSVYAYWGKWDRKNLVLLLPGACIGIVSGYLLAAYVSEAAVSIALGVIALVFSVRQLSRKASSLAGKPHAGRATGWLWGAVSGFTSMISHAGGPPYQVFVLPQRLPPLILAGTTSFYFAILNLLKVLPYFALGQFTPENLATAAVLCPLAALATLAGVQLVKRISADRFYKVIYVLLFCVGAKLLWDGVAQHLV